MGIVAFSYILLCLMRRFTFMRFEILTVKMSVLFCGLWRSVDSCARLRVSAAHTVSIFIAESGYIIFFRNVGVRLQVHTASQPRIATATYFILSSSFSNEVVTF
jgi:hypothetical protein